jgi:hypothetical protein
VKVEILYVAECPSHPEAVRLVKKILTAEGVATKIHEVLVRDEEMANELRFCGSPTIRINGRDVSEKSPKETNFALSCRWYSGAKQGGLPPVEMIHRAVVEARRGSRR